VGGAGDEVAGGDAEPGLGERGVVLVHEGRGGEDVVLVELVEVEWFADAAERDGPASRAADAVPWSNPPLPLSSGRRRNSLIVATTRTRSAAHHFTEQLPSVRYVRLALKGLGPSHANEANAVRQRAVSEQDLSPRCRCTALSRPCLW
jgi:hypothetical protein